MLGFDLRIEGDWDSSEQSRASVGLVSPAKNQDKRETVSYLTEGDVCLGRIAVVEPIDHVLDSSAEKENLIKYDQQTSISLLRVTDWLCDLAKPDLSPFPPFCSQR